MARSTQTDSAVVDTRPEVARVCALAASASPSTSHPGAVSSLRPASIVHPSSFLRTRREPLAAYMGHFPHVRAEYFRRICVEQHVPAAVSSRGERMRACGRRDRRLHSRDVP